MHMDGFTIGTVTKRRRINNIVRHFLSKCTQVPDMLEVGAEDWAKI